MSGRTRCLAAVALTLAIFTSGTSVSADPSPTPKTRAGPNTEVTCGYAHYPLTVFDQPTGAELENHPSAAALRAEIAADKLLPKSGWRLLYRDDDFAEFAAGKPFKPSNGILPVLFERDETGSWKWAGTSYGCTPERYREGAGIMQWWLAKKAKPSGRVVKLSIQERACASGSDPRGRILAPELIYGPKSVEIVLFIKPLSGFQTCQSNPTITYRVKLPGPLGKRKLIDGSMYPLQIRPRDPRKR